MLLHSSLGDRVRLCLKKKIKIKKEEKEGSQKVDKSVSCECREAPSRLGIEGLGRWWQLCSYVGKALMRSGI